MAQLVEQRIRNAQVVGSSPTISSKKDREDFSSLSFLFRLNLIIAYSIHLAAQNSPYLQHFLFL